MYHAFAAIRDKSLSLKRAARNRPKKEVVIALRSFDGCKIAMKFAKDDEFILKSSFENNFWRVKRKETGKVGYVPSNFLVRACDLEHLEWISTGIDKETALQMLLDSNIEAGAFIIRENEGRSISQSLVLSVLLCKDADTDASTIAHFPIEREGINFSIHVNEQKYSMKTLHELVHFFADRNPSNLLLTFSSKKQLAFQTRWEYEGDVIKKGEPIGTGSCGNVYQGLLYRKEVAIKKLKNMNSEEFIKEAELIRSCCHPNVIDIIGICVEKRYIITEYLENGSLKNYMTKHKGERAMSLSERLSVAQSVASGMEYLSLIKVIIHRDLASRNVLVGKTINVVKVADFGMARIIMDSTHYTTDAENFPFQWTAIEAFVFPNEQTGKVTSAADVWSFGVLLWELYSNGKVPYDDILKMGDQYLTTQKINLYKKLTGDEQYRLLQPDGCPDEIYAMMQDCWKEAPKERPSFSELRAILFNIPCEQASQTIEPPSNFNLDF